MAGSAAGGPQPTEHNEFADAVSRMFEHRQRASPQFAPPLRDDARLRDDTDQWESPRFSLLHAPALRRALSIVPLAVIGYAIAWFLYFEPSQNVTAKPVVEAKPEVTPRLAPMPSPPTRSEVVEAKPAPAPAAAPPIAPAPSPAVAETAPSRPLSKDEIKELQGKLGAAGFSAGPIDGVIGPQTQSALRRYAQARNLTTSDATQETLLRLRSEGRASQ